MELPYLVTNEWQPSPRLFRQIGSHKIFVPVHVSLTSNEIAADVNELDGRDLIAAVLDHIELDGYIIEVEAFLTWPAALLDLSQSPCSPR